MGFPIKNSELSESISATHILNLPSMISDDTSLKQWITDACQCCRVLQIANQLPRRVRNVEDQRIVSGRSGAAEYGDDAEWRNQRGS